MSTKNTVIIITLLIIATFTASLVLSGSFPGQMASHWNAAGEVDGYSNRESALYLVPAMQAGLAILLMLVPSIDPRKANIRLFRPLYNLFVVIFVVFMGYIHGLTLAWNLGMKFDFVRWMSPAYALLMFFTGYLVQNAQPNWFIGIRTPWTLSDPQVWAATHKAGGWAFKITGLLCLFGLFFPSAAFLFLLVPAVACALGLIVYSYILYHRLHPENR